MKFVALFVLCISFIQNECQVRQPNFNTPNFAPFPGLKPFEPPIEFSPFPSFCRTSSGKGGFCQKSSACRTLQGASSIRTTCGPGKICCPISLGLQLTKTLPLLAGKTVATPATGKFACGKRGNIAISFGFGSAGGPRLESFSLGGIPQGGLLSQAEFSPVSLNPDFLSRQKRSRNFPGNVALPPGIDYDTEVVGGTTSYRNSWPWMVLLGRKEGPGIDFFCSAIVINQKFLLTAAHCVVSLKPFFARLGEHDYGLSLRRSNPPEDVDVIDVILNPKYDGVKGYNDIALLKLGKAIRIRNEVKPVCLPWGNEINENPIGKQVTVTGWGTVNFGGRPSQVLQEVKLTVFDPSKCQKSYSTLPDYKKEFPEGLTRDNILCAGHSLGGKDTCQGDSGGPLVIARPGGKFSLLGIISQGYGCGKANFPGLYTPIRNFDILTWIKKEAF